MSQPSLNCSYSGSSIAAAAMNRARLSYTSLRASGDNGINLQIEEEGLSTSNVHSFLSSNSSRLSQPDVTRVLRPDLPGCKRRDRLSQPTLVTGDYYPSHHGQQRLSQPCLSTGRDLGLGLHSPLKHKRFGPPAVKVTAQRERLSQLDVGAARYRQFKDFASSSAAAAAKFNRDRFSIPELQTQNDLRLMAGTPKQRFSLDSSLNDPGRASRRLLPIASSPISEHQTKQSDSSDPTLFKNAVEALESVIRTSTTPILQKSTLEFFPPIAASPSPSPPPPLPPPPVKSPIPHRERMSVPEIRNSSLRRLLDPPVKQRHSLTGNLKQCLLPSSGKKSSKPAKAAKLDEALEKKPKENSGDSTNVVDATRDTAEKDEPKHIQRHYAYTYDTKSDQYSLLGKLGVSSKPRKKFLESNFDRNEQVITTVIETEIPVILSSPKYTKKTHAYSSEAPKWMKKYLDNDSPGAKRKSVDGREASKVTARNNWINSNRCSLDSADSESALSEKTRAEKSRTRSEDNATHEVASPKTTEIRTVAAGVAKDTCVRIKPSKSSQGDKYEVPIDSSWTEADICRLYGLECDDTDTEEESTSV